MTRPETNNTSGLNIIPFASMAGGWLGPLLMFWLYVWGPLRPFHYPAGDLAPSWLLFLGAALLSIALWWLPASYYQVRHFESRGRVYERIGIRWFRYLVPDGDLANRWRRREEPGFRMIRDRQEALAFVHRTEMSEKGHLVLLAMGLFSAAFAWQIGWYGWAVYLGAGNVLVNIYPILLQRYTRARVRAVVASAAPGDRSAP